MLKTAYILKGKGSIKRNSGFSFWVVETTLRVLRDRLRELERQATQQDTAKAGDRSVRGRFRLYHVFRKRETPKTWRIPDKSATIRSNMPKPSPSRPRVMLASPRNQQRYARGCSACARSRARTRQNSGPQQNDLDGARGLICRHLGKQSQLCQRLHYLLNCSALDDHRGRA